MVRPGAVRRDPVYGPLLRRGLALLRARSRIVAATRAFDAVDDADEVILGLSARPGERLETAGLTAIIEGVRGDLDPGALVDESGQTIWIAGPSGPVRELVRERSDDPASVGATLFELPGRVWVIASEATRARVREALARPMAPTRPRELLWLLDSSALAIARIDGPSLVDRLTILKPAAALAPLGRRLVDATVDLAPGSEGAFDVGLAYADPSAAGAAEQTLRDILAAIARKRPDGVAWLAAATVDRLPQSSRVSISVPLPSELMKLLHDLEGPAKTRDPRPR